MREKHSLHDQVEMLGAVPHACVWSVLISGHIFLNRCGTDEAAFILSSSYCASDSEVLPDDMIVLAEPDPNDMVQAIMRAISILPRIDPQDMHDCMEKLYNWHDVAKRTEIVYDHALKRSNQNLLQYLSWYLSCGSWAGNLFCLVMIIDFFAMASFATIAGSLALCLRYLQKRLRRCLISFYPTIKSVRYWMVSKKNNAQVEIFSSNFSSISIMFAFLIGPFDACVLQEISASTRERGKDKIG
ncbi:hypothetical protein SLEP1_g34711 [Rubroshorea leprosula]|uniref:Uncharacterized protein n=1 Tax=Rubroshorea leprosula TaxID=152421 RepID=A0AAV5KKW7_9ROSI|nr:hypothetical protein SLEP1_g34711 [Rubroshorea leprosula]